MSTRSTTRAAPPRRSISSMWSSSKCCAGRRARCYGKEHHRRRDQHHFAQAELHAGKRRVEVSGGDLDFRQAKASVSGPLIGDKLAARIGALVHRPSRHDLQHRPSARTSTSRTTSAARRNSCCTRRSRSISRSPATTAGRLRSATGRFMCARVPLSARSTVSTLRWLRPPETISRRASIRSTA